MGTKSIKIHIVSNIKGGGFSHFFLFFYYYQVPERFPAEKGRTIKNLYLYVFTSAAAMAVSHRHIRKIQMIGPGMTPLGPEHVKFFKIFIIIFREAFKKCISEEKLSTGPDSIGMHALRKFYFWSLPFPCNLEKDTIYIRFLFACLMFGWAGHSSSDM